MEPKQEEDSPKLVHGVILNPNNVFFGEWPQRGSIYQQLLQSSCVEYHNLEKPKSWFVEERIVKPVQEKGGRFYKLNASLAQWEEATPGDVINTVSNALRYEVRKWKKTHGGHDALAASSTGATRSVAIPTTSPLPDRHHETAGHALGPSREPTGTVVAVSPQALRGDEHKKRKKTHPATSSPARARDSPKFALARALVGANPNNVCFDREHRVKWLQRGSIYQQLLQSSCLEYHSLEQPKAWFVVQRIVEPVQESGGKFYTWNERSGQWEEAGSKVIIKAVTQALRNEVQKWKKTHGQALEASSTGATSSTVVAGDSAKVAMARALVSANRNNVCFGRGGALISLQKKSLYRQLINSNRADYHKQALPKRGPFVEQRIVKPVIEAGGKFYKWRALLNKWEELTIRDTIAPVSRALQVGFQFWKRTQGDQPASAGAASSEAMASDASKQVASARTSASSETMARDAAKQVATAQALVSVNRNNVCFGRGFALRCLRKGSLYGQLIRDNFEDYHTHVQSKEPFVEHRIVHPVHEAGGKFYKWSADSCEWEEAGGDETVYIVSKALRDEFKRMNKVDAADELAASTGASSGDVIANVAKAPSSPSNRHDETADPVLGPSAESTDHHCAADAAEDDDVESELDNAKLESLIRSIITSESRLRRIRDAIQERARTGNYAKHLDLVVKTSLVSIDVGLTGVELANGITSEASAAAK